MQRRDAVDRFRTEPGDFAVFTLVMRRACVLPALAAFKATKFDKATDMRDAFGRGEQALSTTTGQQGE
jgi:hypothetical protein